MRLFTAIEFSEEIKDKIHESAELLKKECVSGSFTHRENYHLTLVFLGEVKPGRLDELKKVLDSIRMDTAKVRIGKITYFRRDEGNLYYRSVSVPQSVENKYYELCDKFENIGFRIEKRKFRAHITLARKASLRSADSLKRLSECMDDIECTVSSVSLMLSERINGKLTYTCLYRK